MKKLLAMILVAVMVLALCACGGNTVKLPEGQLLVGYARVDLSPPASSGAELLGYGNITDPIYMTGVLDRIYATCVAITDAKDNTVLVFTLDMLYSTYSNVQELRKQITKETGIIGERIVFAATHTHASTHSGAIQDFYGKITQAAVEALADRAPAVVQTGATQIQGLNFVRHYVTQDGTVVGDNFNAAVDKETNPRVKHTTEADSEMGIIRYVRENDKKDILLVNWQAHPKVSSTSETVSGKAQRSMLSADFIGFCRMEVEAQLDCHFAYFTGAAANLNARSHLKEEQTNCPEKVNEYGTALARQLIDGLEGLQEVKGGTVSVEQKLFDVTPVVPDAASQFELNAIRVGSTAFVTVPFEMFDTNGRQIKDNSDCDTTFVLTCSHEFQHEYIPSDYVWDYNTGNQIAYEMSMCRHERGTAEKVADELVSMLKNLA